MALAAEHLTHSHLLQRKRIANVMSAPTNHQAKTTMGTGKQSHHQTASRNPGGLVADRTDNRVTIENVSIHGFLAMLEGRLENQNQALKARPFERTRQWQNLQASKNSIETGHR